MRRTHTAACLLAVLALAQAQGGFVEIGSGTSWSSYVPVRGYRDYSWSRTIYLREEIGSPCVVTALSYHVDAYAAPSNYVMLNQRVYLKPSTATNFPSASYDDPAVSGFTKVFDGSLTWNGAGWHEIQFNAPFVYHGTGSLVVCYENRDGSWASGYPLFNYSWYNVNRSKYNSSYSTFPTNAGSLSGQVPNIRLHWSSKGPWEAFGPSPADQERSVAVDATPTLSWSNMADIVRNAVYFSTNRNDVANTSLTARVLYAGAGVSTRGIGLHGRLRAVSPRARERRELRTARHASGVHAHSHRHHRDGFGRPHARDGTAAQPLRRTRAGVLRPERLAAVGLRRRPEGGQRSGRDYLWPVAHDRRERLRLLPRRSGGKRHVRVQPARRTAPSQLGGLHPQRGMDRQRQDGQHPSQTGEGQRDGGPGFHAHHARGNGQAGAALSSELLDRSPGVRSGERRRALSASD